jgi:eukaryotic-like serine/threonine-protein kinase
MYQTRNAGTVNTGHHVQQSAITSTHMLYSVTGSDFEIMRPLGNGGTSHVYLGQLHSKERGSASTFAAVKLLRPGAVATARRLFYHEGALLPRLQYPQIVGYLERGRGVIPEFGTVDYLALEYIAGNTLEELLRRQRGALPPDTVLGIVAQIVSALDYLHQRGIVHCDLKPSNIMLEHSTPRAVLIDFGIARAPHFVSQPVAVGTPQYMAPEQADPGMVSDRRADLYSLGVVIYELLSGQRLFPLRTIAELRQTGQRLIEQRLLASLDPGVVQVLMQCLHPDPAQRYPTATAVLHELRESVRHLLR